MEEVGDRAGLATTLNNIGAVYDDLGDRQQALTYYQQALPIREEVGDRAGLAVTLNNIGVVYDALGDRQQALTYYQQALPIREEVGDRAGLATTLNNIGVVYDGLGGSATGADLLPTGTAHPGRGGRPGGPGHHPQQHRRGLRRPGGSAAGADLLPTGTAHPGRGGRPGGPGHHPQQHRRGLRRLGDRQQALTYFQQALPIREEVGDRAGLATTLNNIGAVYDAWGIGNRR